MCMRKQQIALVLLGAGLGLALSFALCGWFWRALLAAVLLALGIWLLV